MDKWTLVDACNIKGIIETFVVYITILTFNVFIFCEFVVVKTCLLFYEQVGH